MGRSVKSSGPVFFNSNPVGVVVVLVVAAVDMAAAAVVVVVVGGGGGDDGFELWLWNALLGSW